MNKSHADLPARFRQKMQIESNDGCWAWQACQNGVGYGLYRVGRKRDGTRRTAYAHRIAYELLVGPIPDGLELDHVCRNRGCVNPAHLEPVSHAENMRRSPLGAIPQKRSQTHCIHGHPFDETNTYHYQGHRVCRQCRNDKQNFKKRLQWATMV